MFACDVISYGNGRSKMAADLQKFLFKSKFLRKYATLRTVIVVLALVGSRLVIADGQEQCSEVCGHGQCVEERCICDPGWKGPQCQWCEGRVRWVSSLSSLIFLCFPLFSRIFSLPCLIYSRITSLPFISIRLWSGEKPIPYFHVFSRIFR